VGHLKDINNLNKKLSYLIHQLKCTSVSSNAAYNAPVDKRDIEKLRDTTAYVLESFKNEIIEYLSE
jgi:hypothetical protein